METLMFFLFALFSQRTFIVQLLHPAAPQFKQHRYNERREAEVGKLSFLIWKMDFFFIRFFKSLCILGLFSDSSTAIDCVNAGLLSCFENLPYCCWWFSVTSLCCSSNLFQLCDSGSFFGPFYYPLLPEQVSFICSAFHMIMQTAFKVRSEIK